MLKETPNLEQGSVWVMGTISQDSNFVLLNPNLGLGNTKSKFDSYL